MSQNGTEVSTSPAVNQSVPIDPALIDPIASSIMQSMQSRALVPPADDQVGSGEWLSFAAALGQLVSGSPDLLNAVEGLAVKGMRQYLVDGVASVPSVQDLRSVFRGAEITPRGGSVVRAFWWGFHVQVSHEDLQSFLAGAGGVNDIVGAIGGSVPSPAAPFIALAAAFIAGALGLLKGLDHGRGVYISMSWFAPGVFVPTSV